MFKHASDLPKPNTSPIAAIPREQTPQYLSMARAIAVRMCPDRHQHDDLAGEALLALVESARRFEPQRGHKLISYAWPAMTGRALDSLRRDGRLRRNKEAATKDAPEPTSPSGPLVARAVVQMAMERAQGVLRSDHRKVLQGRYWEGQSLADIARASGWSHAKARRVHKLALGHLRRELDGSRRRQEPKRVRPFVFKT